MKLWIVSNGLQTSEAMTFKVYVRASSEESALAIARRYFEWEKERFARDERFASELYAFCMEEWT